MSRAKFDPLFQEITLAGFKVELSKDAPTDHIILHPEVLQRIQETFSYAPNGPGTIRYTSSVGQSVPEDVHLKQSRGNS